MIAQLILSIVNEGLKFVNEHEARAISERVLKLREAWDEELAKGSQRDDALLDSYERELFNIGELFFAALKQATPPRQ